MASPRKSYWLLPPALLLEAAAVSGWMVSGLVPGGSGAPLACHLAAVGVFGLFVLARFAAGGFGQAVAVAVLAILFAIFVPVAGMLGALGLMCALGRKRGEPDDASAFVIGLPPAESIRQSAAAEAAPLAEPLIRTMRTQDSTGLQRLTLGLKHRRPGSAMSILRRFRHSGDTTLQLYAQGILSDTLAGLDAHLHALTQRAAGDPEDDDSRLAIAEIHLFMVCENLDPFGGREIQIRKALTRLAECSALEPPRSPGPRRLYLEARCHLALENLDACKAVLNDLSAIPQAAHLSSRIGLRVAHAKRAWNALAGRVRGQRFALDPEFSEPCRFWRDALPAPDA